MLQRFLDPGVLASISSLDLLARTVVDGFVAGLHRSPDFGFSQEFAEYRAYTPGDDLRHVDWNVFARTERAYLKRYRGGLLPGEDAARRRRTDRVRRRSAQFHPAVDAPRPASTPAARGRKSRSR